MNARSGLDLLIKGGRVIDPASGMDGVQDVLIRGGRIAAVAADLSAEAPQLDASGLAVTPGFVDLHTHLREPGEEHKETIATGDGGRRAGRLHDRLRHAEHAPADGHGRGRGAGSERRS